MEMDSVQKAVGFEMNNLKDFPFSRLPIALQLESIDELNVEEKMKLFNVNSGFRVYFARNGPFRRHINVIGTNYQVYLCGPQDAVVHTLTDEKEQFEFPSELSYYGKKLLLRKIRSCEKFFMETDDLPHIDLVDSDEETINYCVDCFENLRMVSEFWASKLKFPILRKVLTSLQFKVTDWARLYFDERSFSDEEDFSESAEFLKSYFETQLKNCKNVAIIDWGAAEEFLEETLGFQLEDDPKKSQEILDAFRKLENEEQIPASCFSEIKCYRRKIGEDDLGYVMISLD